MASVTFSSIGYLHNTFSKALKNNLQTAWKYSSISVR